ADLYRAQREAFPAECITGDYERRIQAAYPIHPEVFDQLYGGWSTLVKFQRTRGVLRLMAAVIHSLWEKGDRNPLILPATIPIDDPRVQFELTRYLSDNWAPIIERDVDGPNALPLKIDAEQSHLGRLGATRRVARTIYLGSAPTAAAHRGIEERRIILGCVMPGESPLVFGDALRRLAAQATYLYQDGARFWYATQPTVARLAEDRAEQLKRDPDRVFAELERRLRDNLRRTGDFSRVHALPRTSADVPDDRETRLVALAPDYPYSKEPGSAAEAAARDILEKRGNAPRLYRNTLVFLAADRVRLQDLTDAVRRFLAWSSILDDKEALDLSPHQVRQAEAQRQSADLTVTARLPETYHWLLVPEQKTPSAPITWQAIRLAGNDALASQASRKLKNDELLITALGATVLREYLDRIPLWRGDHVTVRQIVDDFAQYLYLPRLAGPDVLLRAVRDGVALLTWQTDSFAYAEGFDEATGRYRGLRAGQVITIQEDDRGMLVKPDVAQRQMAAESAASAAPLSSPDVALTDGGSPAPSVISGAPGDRAATPATGALYGSTHPAPVVNARPRRFHGSAPLDPLRVGRDAARIAEEIIAHLLSQGAEVTVTLEIQARLPEGASEQLVRIVSENSRALRFESYGFEQE
ncbi:MAG: DUF499 domain-containing protein, partial [Roseiflexus sp.]|nr:DUF499 domain-containing protein [Roseiflexus sp.]